MTDILKVSVEITFVNGYKYPPVIGFDFGDFAILLTYDSHEGGCFSIYYDAKYADFSRSLELYLKVYDGIEKFSFRLSFEIVEKIRETFKKWRKIPYGKLFSVLENCVPRDILPTFFPKT